MSWLCTQKRAFGWRNHFLWAHVLGCLALVLYVSETCDFVTLKGYDPSAGDLFEIERGANRGKLLPGDSCQPYGKYDNLDLDGQSVVVRVMAATSVAFMGLLSLFVVFIIPFCFPPKWDRLFQFTGAGLHLLTALMQGLTMLMLPSDLCRGAEMTVLQGVEFDSCSMSSGTYVAIVACVINTATCVLFLITPLDKPKVAPNDSNDIDELAQETSVPRPAEKETS